MTGMKGYTTNYVNLIKDNLRDRYNTGFPILKELIQNADDAQAKSFVFGSHPGFESKHPLLSGSGLWFFNDGKFRKDDIQSLRSFGINAKAGDGSTIGKFGLGMKSVFHLCEALFYVAWDGTEMYREGLTPWKSAEHNPHPEWDETSETDWLGLENFARTIVADHEQSWFLLWIPLRQKRHLLNAHGNQKGAILTRFPGDDPTDDLGFLNQAELLLAEILPLLRHLERIEHRADSDPFVLELKVDQRLLMAADGQNERQSIGSVALSHNKLLLAFAGLRRISHDSDGVFLRLRENDKWPRTWYLDEDGHEKEALDKTRPEGAVMFCSGPETVSRLDIHWAVFLPLEYGSEQIVIESGERGHRLVLHGQFFIDAGRKGITGFEWLGASSDSPKFAENDTVDETTLQKTWNRMLAQQVLLPQVLPALQCYATTARLLPSRPKIVIFYPRAGCRCGAGGCQPVREAVAAGLGRGAV